MEKRAQITVFIIIAVVMLMFSSLMYFVLSSKPVEEAVKTPVDLEGVRTFIDSCVSQTARQSLFYFGFIGGDVTPDPFTKYYEYDSFYKIPFAYYEGRSLYPDEDSIKQDILARHVDQNLLKCINDFDGFKDFTFKYDSPKTIVDIKDNSVRYETVFKVTAVKGDSTTKVMPVYVVEIDSRLKEMIKITREVVSLKIADDTVIPWDYLTYVNEQNLDMTAYMNYNKTVIYRITDKNNDLFGKDYVLQFAVKAK